jgi:sugar lactone lactonase YvrE
VFPNILDGDCANRPPEGPGRNPGCDFVPTSLAQDAQGNIYVGALAGEAGGEGRVVKLDPSGKTVLKTWTGLTTVTGVAVGKDGSVYASELFGGSESAPGDLVKISPNGTRTVVTVPFPAGVAVDAADNVFVSAWSVATDAGFGPPNSSGQIWRLRF